jgi:hypothetical protein
MPGLFRSSWGKRLKEKLASRKDERSERGASAQSESKKIGKAKPFERASAQIRAKKIRDAVKKKRKAERRARRGKRKGIIDA